MSAGDGIPGRPGMAGANRHLRIFLGAFGDPGHAFPMLALGAALVRRGHEVALETWVHWQEHVEREGMRFLPAPEYRVFPTLEHPLQPYEAVVRATAHTRPTVAELRPHVLVHDILTLAPAMAGELEGVPVATLIPHIYPPGAPGFPPYALGARLPRTATGRRLWDGFAWPVGAGLRRGRSELNQTRRRLGLAPSERLHGGISPELAIVGTFPQLEYPRSWRPECHVVGPLAWEPPYHEVPAPAGHEPLVVVAPSTAQDPLHRLLRCAVQGLSGEPVRVLAATNRRPLPRPLRVGANVHLTGWISYSRTMPQASLVIMHAGHGTMARALGCGAPVLAIPHSGDMGENAARVAWAGAGLRLPWRLLTPRTLRLSARLALETPSLAERAHEIAAWARTHDPATRAAELVEALALSRSDSWERA
ncbi:MAG: glycosyltransferase [Solirubrobacteraceae bacterium]